MKVRPIFAWYDLWAGLFWDRQKKRLYIFPVPCFGIVFDLERPMFVVVKYHGYLRGEPIGIFTTETKATKFVKRLRFDAPVTSPTAYVITELQPDFEGDK